MKLSVGDKARVVQYFDYADKEYAEAERIQRVESMNRMIGKTVVIIDRSDSHGKMFKVAMLNIDGEAYDEMPAPCWVERNELHPDEERPAVLLLRKRIQNQRAELRRLNKYFSRRAPDWSFIRRVLEQGAAIQQDYVAGKYETYEHYSARMDEAARERIKKG